MEYMTEFVAGRFAWVPPLLAAPFIGSFLGVLIQRLPEGRPIGLARSQCDSCGHTLAAVDLVPYLSFAALRGRCRTCGAAIGWFAPAVELAALGVAAWTALAVPPAGVWLSCLLGWTLLACAWTDLRTMLLPDLLTLPLLVLGLGATAVLDMDALLDHVLATALGYLSLFALAAGYRRLRGRDGLGLGDAKLLAALGAWLGLEALPVALLMAACLGLLAALVARLAGYTVTARTRLPFGPFLALAGWLAWLYGDNLAARLDELVGMLGS